jgi:hypothetical protein
MSLGMLSMRWLEPSIASQRRTRRSGLDAFMAYRHAIDASYAIGSLLLYSGLIAAIVCASIELWGPSLLGVALAFIGGYYFGEIRIRRIEAAFVADGGILTR